jgi:hypothetical protein
MSPVAPGCWEAQASGPALEDFARKRAAQIPESSLAKLGDAVEARDVIVLRDVPILAAQLGPNSGLVGAASLFL